MMASPHALLETQALKQLAQIVKTNSRTGGAAEKHSQGLLSSMATFYAQTIHRRHRPASGVPSPAPGGKRKPTGWLPTELLDRHWCKAALRGADFNSPVEIGRASRR